MFRRMVQGLMKAGFSEKQAVRDLLNKERDWLKHAAVQHGQLIEITEFDAAFMVIRALTHLPAQAWDDRMLSFKGWYFEQLELQA